MASPHVQDVVRVQVNSGARLVHDAVRALQPAKEEWMEERPYWQTACGCPLFPDEAQRVDDPRTCIACRKSHEAGTAWSIWPLENVL